MTALVGEAYIRLSN